MKHKLICLILCLLLLPSLFLSVGAEQQYVIDNADLMSSSEEAALEEKAQALRQEYGMDVVILTVDSLDGKRPQEYADDYYDYNGYANDGVLFLLSMEERDWYISTKGNAIYALTDYGIQQVGESALPYLKTAIIMALSTHSWTLCPPIFPPIMTAHLLTVMRIPRAIITTAIRKVSSIMKASPGA